MVRRLSTGSYEVRFPALRLSEDPKQLHLKTGVNVSAIGIGVGTGSQYCTTRSWRDTVNGAIVGVRCYNANGSAADSQFTIQLASTFFGACN